ncbi:MAG: hypothetical protein FWC87_11450, partial [Acidimicrobiaceae bacterium]|nr:hypothetical protein [Acidimicrobiaceae bacterium]
MSSPTTTCRIAGAQPMSTIRPAWAAGARDVSGAWLGDGSGAWLGWPDAEAPDPVVSVEAEVAGATV